MAAEETAEGAPAEGAPMAAEETPAKEEQPAGMFFSVDPAAHAQQQKELKEKIIADIEKRSQQIEQGKMIREDVRPEEQEVLPPVAPPEELDPAAAAKAGSPDAVPEALEAPEAADPPAVAVVKVKEEQDDEDSEPSLVVQDLRFCQACQSKSYIRQGLFINIYCRLYYMARADSGTRLCARGKLSEGRKWSPKKSVESGNFASVEEQLLTDNWKEAMEAGRVTSPRDHGHSNATEVGIK